MGSEKKYKDGIVGKKLGMSQVFTEQGKSVPVTVIEAGPCYILDIKTTEKDGYKAVQLGFEQKKMQRVTSPMKGHFSKAGKGAFYHVKEIRCDNDSLGWSTVGQEVKVDDVFKGGEIVDVTGISIGKGFQGVVKRHGMKGQPMTRGTHEVRRHVGSIGCRKFPGRVFKNKRMPGHMGDRTVTVQNLEIVAVNTEQNLILIKGGIPGSKGNLVVIKRAAKREVALAAA